MKVVNVGLIGFGTVGKGVVKALLSKKKILEAKSGLSVNLAKIADKDPKSGRGVRVPARLLTKDVDSVIRDKSIDILVELIGGIHPAKEIILKALSLGKSVVTANKALLAEYGNEIFIAASRFGGSIEFEASVGGGIPIIAPLKNSLISNDIELVYGILNGTSNFILSKMSEDNCTFSEALNDARARGIAEKNPKLDISGVDSCHKLAILTRLGFGFNVKPKNIYVEGIEGLGLVDMQYAKRWGYDIKLLAIAKKVGNALDLRVHPTLIPLRSILASIKSEDNAIFIRGDMVGEALFYGKGAGSLPTASSVVGDIIKIAGNIGAKTPVRSPWPEFGSGLKKVRKINDLSVRCYVRFSAIDRPGVLSGVSEVLAQNGISIATVSQKERKKGQSVPIVMLTHYANEGKMNKALARIDRLPFITKKTVRIRMV